VAYLDGPRVGGVQARRLPYNAGQNLLTRMQADEFGIFMTLFQRARERLRAFVAFAGNGLVLRRDALEAVGGWHEDALTEDIDLSVRFHLRGWQIRYCEEAVVWEEAVPTVRDLVRQRTRWFEGAMQALGEHLPAILFGRLPLQTRVDVLFFLAGSLVATLALLTTYAYGLLRLAGVVVLFLQVSPHLMAGASGLCSLSLLGAVVERLGWRPAQLVGVPLRFALFSLHRFVVVPYAIALGDREKILRDGFSLLELKRFAERRGYVSAGYRLGSVEDLARLKVPAITLTNVRGYAHFVVIKGVAGGQVYVADPAFGNRSRSLRAFEREWNRIILVVLDAQKQGNTAFMTDGALKAPTGEVTLLLDRALQTIAPRPGEFGLK
jgi:hypothetical protein